MLDEILQRQRAVFLNSYFDKENHVPPPQGLEREYIMGIHREPKAGQQNMTGSRRVPQAYIYEKGRRVSTGRTQRFSAR